MLGVTAFADDLLVLSHQTPFVGEAIPAYFARLGIVTTADPPILVSEAGQRLAVLAVGFEKSEISYARVSSTPSEPTDETADGDVGDADAMRDPATEDEDDQGVPLGGIGDVNPDFSAAPSTDWGGRLRTVLRSPFRRERMPRQMGADVTEVVRDLVEL